MYILLLISCILLISYKLIVWLNESDCDNISSNSVKIIENFDNSLKIIENLGNGQYLIGGKDDLNDDISMIAYYTSDDLEPGTKVTIIKDNETNFINTIR